MLTGQLNVAWCEVDSGDCCSGERVLAQVDALATADIKGVQAGGALVVEGVGHPGCVGSASGEEVAGTFCGRAARIGRPLLDRTRLRVSYGLGGQRSSHRGGFDPTGGTSMFLVRPLLRRHRRSASQSPHGSASRPTLRATEPDL